MKQKRKPKPKVLKLSSDDAIDIDEHVDIRFISRGRVGGRVTRRKTENVDAAMNVLILPTSHKPEPQRLTNATPPSNYAQAFKSGSDGIELPQASSLEDNVIQQNAPKYDALLDWVSSCPAYLDDLLELEGLTQEAEKNGCCDCGEKTSLYRCKECMGDELFCATCMVREHIRLPLHCIEEWTGSFWKKTTLICLGLIYQFGHRGKLCPYAMRAKQPLTVIDLSGIHLVNINWCNCSAILGKTRRRTHLLRTRWFPVTDDRPRTVITFDALQFFHLLTVQAKTTFYDFYEALSRRIDNSGIGRCPDRYRECLRAFREWRYLKMLKRHAHGHDPNGINAKPMGSCAVECPACPQPGRNLPSNWRQCPEHLQFLYRLMLSLDANFRLKLKERGIHDVCLGSGSSYLVEDTSFKAHIAVSKHAKEMNTCGSRLSAVDHANTRYSSGYAVTGVGAVVCARHTLIRKNGVCDLQKGERFANMDYIFLATLIGCTYFKLLVIYDIACQWSINLVARMAGFPKEMCFDTTETELTYCIPKGHIKGHGQLCQAPYSLNVLPGCARTDGEGVERDWAHMNALVASIREMGPGNRHETLDDHWGFWNWLKIVKLGVSLLKKLKAAVINHAEQEAQHLELTVSCSASRIDEWDVMIKLWEGDHNQPNPYDDSAQLTTLSDVRFTLAQEDAEALKNTTDVYPHEVTPSAFLNMGLELEEQQRLFRIREQHSSLKTKSEELADLQDRRNVLQSRLNGWSRIQAIYMPAVVELRKDSQRQDDDVEGPNSTGKYPEDVTLFMPSQLPQALWKTGCSSGLHEREMKLRLAQAADALNHVKHHLCIYSGLVAYKIKNVSGPGQKANTRARKLLVRFRDKINRSAERYRVACGALLVLDSEGDWKGTYQPLLSTDLRGPNGVCLKASENANSKQSLRMGEGYRKISWIWKMNRKAQRISGNLPEDGSEIQSELLTDMVNSEDDLEKYLRVEYAKSKARVVRWHEEILLVTEEMRRSVMFLVWKASWWRDQGAKRITRKDLQRGLLAYALRQEYQLLTLAGQFAALWLPALEACTRDSSWISASSLPQACVIALLEGLQEQFLKKKKKAETNANKRAKRKAKEANKQGGANSDDDDGGDDGDSEDDGNDGSTNDGGDNDGDDRDGGDDDVDQGRK